MSNPCAVTVPLSKIARIQVYVNTRRRTLAQIMRETGADFGLNGTLYNMRTLAVNCHLRADGKVLANPAYTVAGYAWDQGPDIRMDMLPDSARNYIACTPIIVSGKPLSKLTYDKGKDGTSGQAGKRGRSAIGLKGGSLALYCSQDGSKDARTPEALRNDLAREGWESAIMLDGRALAKLTYDPGQGGKRGRSAIGLKNDRLALYCSRDGSGAARTPEALRDDLARAGWDSAVMLDGGVSSQCDFLGQRITSPRRAQHYLLVYLKREGCPYPEPTVNIRWGSTGSGASWVQWQLRRHGAAIEVDGIFGAASTAALRAFQKAHGLAADGICGPATRAALRKEA